MSHYSLLAVEILAFNSAFRSVFSGHMSISFLFERLKLFWTFFSTYLRARPIYFCFVVGLTSLNASLCLFLRGNKKGRLFFYANMHLSSQNVPVK